MSYSSLYGARLLGSIVRKGLDCQAGCSLNFLRFYDIFQTLAFLGVCVHFTLGAPDGRSNSSAAGGLAEFRKIKTF